MALRSDGGHVLESVGLQTKEHGREPTLAPSKRDRRVSQHRRHTRIVSEGCLRSLIDTPKLDLPSELDTEGEHHRFA
jgi:hypothetical protein